MVVLVAPEDRKPTEEEIVKYLECIAAFEDEFPERTFRGASISVLLRDTIDLINRKNAEIEDLQNQLSIFEKLLDKAEAKMEAIRAEAIKYFSAVVKFKVEEPWLYGKKAICRMLDEIAKEMGVM